MDIKDIKIGEEFTKDGKLYKKTKDGIVSCENGKCNVDIPNGNVILEKQLLRG